MSISWTSWILFVLFSSRRVIVFFCPLEVKDGVHDATPDRLTIEDYIMVSDLSNTAAAAGTISSSLANALQSPTTSISPTVSAALENVTAVRDSTGWLGGLGWLILGLLNIITTVLYWTVKIVTFNVPSILFTLFSTSWTVTMNATTMLVKRFVSSMLSVC